MNDKALPKKIRISESVMKSVEEHCYSNLEAEVGGMFFGDMSSTVTQIEGFIPATKAAAEQISLTFTHEVWDDILNQGEKFFPGKSIVGWYHTHPNFGLFLSDYDQFIQRNFFGELGHLALVIDPIEGTLAWFANKRNSKIDIIHQAKTFTGPRQTKSVTTGETQAHKQSWAYLMGAVALTACITWGVTAFNQVPDLRPSLSEAREEIGQLRDLISGRSFLLTVGSDVNLDQISAVYYKDAKAGLEILKSYNPELVDKQVQSGGQVIVVDADLDPISRPELPAEESPRSKPSAEATPSDATSAPSSN